MKRKDGLKIDILSAIDEDIIERNSQKRARLMFGGRRRRQKKIFMISGIVSAACLCLAVTTLLMQLLPLTPPPTGEKQVPVYQGMTVSTLSPSEQAVLDSPASFMTLSANDILPRLELLDSHEDNSGNNGNGNSQNAPGHNKPADSNIAEEILRDPPEVIGASEALYYALPNQDIYITIHFHNPDDFEILSFTLNEKKYSSNMFEAGSNMENLILKVNVGDVEGIIEYTIDAIKYVDGTEIKDVIIDGDKTVKVGVFTEKQPAATVDLGVAGINKIDITLDLSDEMELIGISNGFVKAVLTEGENIVDMQDISLGDDISVTFGGLRSNTKYKYSVVATYDALDGLGFTSYVLYEEEILTEEYVAFDGVTVEQESISFGYQWNSALTDEQKTIVALELYHGDEKVRDIDVSTTEIDGLLSNNEYRLLARFVNGELDESISLTFTTKAKAAPDFTLSEIDKTQTSFKFDVDVTDVDTVGAITKIELLHGEDEPVVANSIDVREFTSLLSNNKYTVRVTYTYDINDGVGAQTVVKTLDGITEAKAVPVINITLTQANSYGMKFDLSLTDPDVIGTVTDIIFKDKHGTVLAAGNADMRSYDELNVRETYTLTVICDYDLNDGDGVQQTQKTVDVYAAPNMETPYTVKHYIEELDGSYTLKDTDNLTGEEATNVTPDRKSYTGFTSPKAQTKLINREGDMLIEYYYTRNSYTVTFVTNGGDEIEPWTGKYGQPIPYTDATREGFTFGGWFADADLTIPQTTVVDSDVCLYAWWQEEEKPSSFKYTEIDSGIEITSLVSTSLTSVVIPSHIGGVEVTSIGFFSFNNRSTIKNVTLPYCTTQIAQLSFAGCTSLTDINIPDGLIYIGHAAFSGCSSLTNISIPSSVTTIAFDAFQQCSRLETLTVNSDNEVYYSSGNCIIEKSTQTLVTGCNSSTIPNGVKKIGRDAFSGRVNITTVIIPDSVTEIDIDAFKGCSSLSTVVIGNGVLNIGHSAFYGCTNLSNVTMGNKIQTIDNYAFSSCSVLKEITIPYSVTKIEYYAFEKCTSLTSVTFENPSGWQAINPWTNVNTHFFNLSDISAAAKYLTDTHCQDSWTRS